MSSSKKEGSLQRVMEGTVWTQKYDVSAFGFDPYNAKEFVTR